MYVQSTDFRCVRLFLYVIYSLADMFTSKSMCKYSILKCDLLFWADLYTCIYMCVYIYISSVYFRADLQMYMYVYICIHSLQTVRSTWLTLIEGAFKIKCTISNVRRIGTDGSGMRRS